MSCRTSSWRMCLSILGILCCVIAVRAEDQPATVEKDEGFVALFDGKTFQGWEGNLKHFRIEDGAVVAGTMKETIPRNEFLCTKQEFGDFELRLQAKLVGEGANAGVQFRTQRIPDHHEVIGYQCDMGHMQGRWIWASLYDESRRKTFLAHGDADAVAKALKPNDWNDLIVRCEGPRVQMWLNGVKTVDYREADQKVARTGIIGVQIHGGPPSEASYRKIRLKRLDAK
jgi:3-keto-disaccharide hydrolase